MNSPSPVPPASKNIRTNISLTSADGTRLVGDLYIPHGTPPFPAVMQITPYNARDLDGLGRIYAARGFLFLALDARGRYRSAGVWEPLLHDQIDGHAALDWLAQHPLCNGRVGTRGHSYCGYNQLLTAIDAPAALQAMVVTVAPGDPFVNVPFVGGAYDISDLVWLLGMTGRVCQDAAPDEDFGIRRFGTRNTSTNPYENDTSADTAEVGPVAADGGIGEQWDAVLRQRPFGEIDLHLGVYHEIFREWTRHWQMDDYWSVRSVGERLDRISVPALFISGWWDNNGRGATHFFRGLREQPDGSPGVDDRQRLLMGPWQHDLKPPYCGDLPAAESRLIERGAARDELNDEFAWMDAHLRDIPAGPSTRARATLYVTGLYRWLDFDDWPPAQTETRAYYLHAGEAGGGTLLPVPPGPEAGCSRYRFDPDDPTPFAQADVGIERCPFDNAELAATRNDILVFETEPLSGPLALVGEVAAILYAEADTPDFDLCVKLLDRYPDGRAIFLGDGVLRARFRDGWERPAAVQPGEVHAYRIDLWHLGHVLRSGHALQLEVASGAFRRIDVNACTGGDPAMETDTQQARIDLYHSAAYPSQLLLPLCGDPRLLEPG